MSEAQADGQNDDHWEPNHFYAVACSYSDINDGKTTKRVILNRMVEVMGLTRAEAEASYNLAKEANLI